MRRFRRGFLILLALNLCVGISLGRASNPKDEPIVPQAGSTTQKISDWFATFRKSEGQKKVILVERENRRIAAALNKKAEEERKKSGASAEEIKKKFNQQNQSW